MPYFEAVLIHQKDRDKLINISLILRALLDQPIDKIETNDKALPMLLFQLFFTDLQQIHILLKELKNSIVDFEVSHEELFFGLESLGSPP